MDCLPTLLCLEIVRDAANNRNVCVRRLAERHSLGVPAVLDTLADLSLSGVLVCRVTDVPGFLSLELGPKSIQAIFLFALNCDALCAECSAVSPSVCCLAIVGGKNFPPGKNLRAS